MRSTDYPTKTADLRGRRRATRTPLPIDGVGRRRRCHACRGAPERVRSVRLLSTTVPGRAYTLARVGACVACVSMVRYARSRGRLGAAAIGAGGRRDAPAYWKGRRCQRSYWAAWSASPPPVRHSARPSGPSTRSPTSPRVSLTMYRRSLTGCRYLWQARPVRRAPSHPSGRTIRCHLLRPEKP